MHDKVVSAYMKDTIHTREFSINDYDAAVELWKRVEGLEIAEGDDKESVARFLTRNPGLSRVATDGSAIIGVSLGGPDGRRGHSYHFAVMTKARELRLAKRMARLGTETAFEVLVKARALEAKGRNIVHLEIGEPDFDTPANIIEAAADALHKGFTHYGPSAGLQELRETIAGYVSETRGVSVTPEEVVVVPGGKPVIFFSILALAEEGVEVIYPNPGVRIYESMINYVG